MSSFMLKILAIITMTIDHIGYEFFPGFKIWGIKLFRFIGRIAFPIFAFQIALGYKNTSSKEKYLFRMFILAVVSQIPFSLMDFACIPFSFNVGVTFLCALLILYSYDKMQNKFLKYLSIGALLALSYFVPMDYGLFGVSLVLLFYIFQNSKFKMSLASALAIGIYCWVTKSLFELPALIALIPILLYNGQKGKSLKYWFYAYYPVHMLLIGIGGYLMWGGNL